MYVLPLAIKPLCLKFTEQFTTDELKPLGEKNQFLLHISLEL